MSEAQAAQRDDSPMDVDQPSPLEQDVAPLGMISLQTANNIFAVFLSVFDFAWNCFYQISLAGSQEIETYQLEIIL